MSTPERYSILAHYTTASTLFSHILTDRSYLGGFDLRVRLGSADAVRDPIENKPVPTAGMTPGHGWVVGGRARKALRHVRLLCLTQDDPVSGDERYGRAYARPSLWEHYAENHAGVCLLFDRAKLLDLWEDQHGDGCHGPVTYVDSVQKALYNDVFTYDDHLAGRSVPDLYSHIWHHRSELYYSKLTDWRNQSEYRLLKLVPEDADEGPVVLSAFSALTGVVLGERFPQYARAGAANTLPTVTYGINWYNGPELTTIPRSF